MISINDRIKQKKFKNDGQAALLSLMVAASHLKEQFSIVCKKENITIQQYNILRILKGKYPDGYARCDITERMIERAPDTTRLIDRMIKLKLVEKQKCNEDARRSLTKITSKGLDVIKKMNTEEEKFQKSIENKLGSEACRSLVNFSEKIINLK